MTAFPIRTWMPFRLDAWESLPDEDRDAILAVFVPHFDGAGDVEWKLRQDRGFGPRGISGNEAAAAIKALRKLADVPVLTRSKDHGNRLVPLLRPPEAGALRTWYLHRGLKGDARWPTEALAHSGSPVFDYLKTNRSTDASRKVLVIDLIKAVDQFKRDAPRWWFGMCLSSAVTEWPYRRGRRRLESDAL